MTTREAILYTLKRSLFEYSLRHNIEPIVNNYALDKRFKFSSYNIATIRFELFNLYKIVKDRHSSKFNGLIEFLIEFHKSFPNILPEKLFIRVVTSLKALYIYECLRNGDLKKTSSLIKEYFPLNGTSDSASQNSDDAQKEKEKTSKSFELKILKLRLQWNELILSKSKRSIFFEKQFHVQYDDEFLNFLFNKTLIIIETINNYLPLTQIDQIIKDNFKNVYKTLFNQNMIEMELEDDVRFELYLDNLKLHQIEISSHLKNNSNNNTANKQNGVIPYNKHLKKLYKVLCQWQIQLDQAESSIGGETCFTQACSQQITDLTKSIVHELLYLDSQFDNFQIQCNLQYEGASGFEVEPNNNKEIQKENTSSLITNDTDPLQQLQNSLTFVTEMNSLQNGNFLAINSPKNQNQQPSELITDDERDTNLSF